MKKLILMLLFTSGFLLIRAQDITVGGVVTAADGETMIGATVLQKGTTNGTITDLDGYYELTVPQDAVLVYSFVGMVSQEIEVNGRTSINVTLEAESFGLDEIVVIGYGTQKKRDVTGAVATVGSKTIGELQPARVEQALQGTLAGVNVTSQSGSPGSGINIRIRGISTNGDAAPLVIIDGYIGDLNSVNPDDIESISVLKDAQAAIYGTIAANGVILVTTKSGKRDTPTQVSFKSIFGIQETTRKLPLLNATEYGILLNESYAANGQQIPFPDLSSLGRGTDWQDQIFETAPLFDNNLSISGGTEKMDYSLSVGNLSQDGIIGGDRTGFDRTTGKVALGADFTDWLLFKSNLFFTNINRRTLNDFGLGSILFNAINMPPTLPVYDENGNFFQAPLTGLGNEIINPVEQIANTFNEYTINKLNGLFSLQASFAKHFTATARVGFNFADDNSKTFFPIVDYGGKVFDVTRNSVTQAKNAFRDYSFDAFVNYDNTFVEDHSVNVTLGTTVFRSWGNSLSATGFDVPNNSWDFADISLANGLPTAKNVGSSEYDFRRLSYFSRVQYSYRSKYLFSAILRRDASLRFGPDNSVGYFPSFTAGWVISDEMFMDDVDFVNQLKLRLSYGIMGSDRIGDFLYRSLLTGEAMYVLSGNLTPGLAIGPLANPDVGWERSKQFDIGIDVKFLEDKIDVTLDYFNRLTDDLLLPAIPVSGILGTSAPGALGPTINAGAVRNTGVEFAIGLRGGNAKSFSYGLNYNVTYLKNEVTKVDNGTGFIEGGSFGVGQPLPSRMVEGQPIGVFFGYETDGIFQTVEEAEAHPSQAALGAQAQPGDIRYKDINGDEIIDLEDRTFIGSPIPDFTMGFNVNLNYNGFDFLVYTFASIGNDIVRNYERTQTDVNRLDFYLDRWQGAGTSNDVPRVTTAATTNKVFSDFFVEDGSYVRIQRVQLGYTLPTTLTQKARIQSVRFFVSIDNLYTFTKYKGYDPAASSGAPIGSGIDFGFYPISRVYSFGLSLNI